MSEEIRRPPTRYILARLEPIVTPPDVVECATIADIYWAMHRWFPQVSYYAAVSSTTLEFVRRDNNYAIAQLREVFE